MSEPCLAALGILSGILRIQWHISPSKMAYLHACMSAFLVIQECEFTRGTVK